MNGTRCVSKPVVMVIGVALWASLEEVKIDTDTSYLYIATLHLDLVSRNSFGSTGIHN